MKNFKKKRRTSSTSWKQSESTCEQITLTRHVFSSFSALITLSHVTLAQGVCARHVIHVSCAWLCVFDLPFDSPLCTLHSLSHLLLHLHLLCGSVRREFPCALPRMRSLTLWSTTPLSQHWGEVQRTHERIEESRSWVSASEVEKEVSWVSLQAEMRQSEETPMKKQEFHKKTEWSFEKQK